MIRPFAENRRARAAAGLLLGIAVACVGNAPPGFPTTDPTCAAAATSAGVRWLRVSSSGERPSLDRWCAGVGPPVVIPTPRTRPEVPVVVSWNTHEGGGNIDALVADLKAGRLTGSPVTAFVLLLQEVYRSGADVPAGGSGPTSWASAVRSPGSGGTRDDIVTVAGRLQLAGFYVPSMRNGEPGVTTEDRGNAILSTLPLSELTAIELPLERQRRVAVQATVMVGGSGRDPLPLRLISTHFTNMVMHHLWLLSESGRMRQARALARVLPGDGPLIVGGDFNAWFGFRDAAYRELARRVPPAAEVDRRATFGPMRLDHILLRLPDRWRASVRRAESRYGSDHYPLVAMIDAPR